MDAVARNAVWESLHRMPPVNKRIAARKIDKHCSTVRECGVVRFVGANYPRRCGERDNRFEQLYFFFNKNRLGWQFLKSPARCDSWNSSVFDAVKAVVPLLTQSVWRSDAEIGFSTFPCWWSATLWPLWQFGSRLAGVRESSKRSLQLKNIKKM